MRPIQVVTTAVGVSPIVPMDYMQDPFNVGLGCVITGGTPTYTVEHTFDDIFDPLVTPVWFANVGITARTANTDGNYAFPVRALRLNQTAGAGGVRMTVLQGAQK